MESTPLSEPIIYLDNAATVYPKPPEILDAALDLYKRYGVNPGRSGTTSAWSAATWYKRRATP